MAQTFQEATAAATAEANGQANVSENASTQVETPIEGASPAPAETQQNSEEGGGENAASNDTAFFDASKVPAELKESFLQMQRAWTAKTQEIAPWKKVTEQYGSPDEVLSLLQQLQDPKGLLSFWVETAQRLGITEEQLETLLAEEEEAPTVEASPEAAELAPSKQYMTLEDFQQWQQQQDASKAESAEDAEVDQLLKGLNLEPDVENIVTLLASYEPPTLGYEERIQRGLKKYQTLLDTKVSDTVKETAKNNEMSPAALGGGSPGMEAEEIKGFGQATKAARQFLNSR